MGKRTFKDGDWKSEMLCVAKCFSRIHLDQCNLAAHKPQKTEVKWINV